MGKGKHGGGNDSLRGAGSKFHTIRDENGNVNYQAGVLKQETQSKGAQFTKSMEKEREKTRAAALETKKKMEEKAKEAQKDHHKTELPIDR